jgi:lysophospholipid acyltransferase (LPLAT)-like uncharacterized protein
VRGLVPYLVYAYVTFVGWTTRLTKRGYEHPEAVHACGRRFIYAFWHQRQVFFTWSHRDAEAAVLVSKSKDGELIAETMRLSRIAAVRGSSSRGGAAAAREMIEVMRGGRDIGITPDGPKGPAREVKDGVIFLARALDAPILPITNALSHKLELKKAWDRFQVPLPFGRAVVAYGAPIEVKEGDDPKAKAAELKAALDKLTDEAEAELA